MIRRNHPTHPEFCWTHTAYREIHEKTIRFDTYECSLCGTRLESEVARLDSLLETHLSRTHALPQAAQTHAS